ncbi:MAG: alpha-L-glutamate ligase-like protein [Polycyclovorans sp.]|jgi:alpha-L-glutamate ligase-like protein|nr:alpha-L-glutamate ligase-like protein [Polycyclovorans sp.]|tara:strand:- start:5365 stop:6321 length:957 start_codon:yes stop_codon:yes gene_type:complete
MFFAPPGKLKRLGVVGLNQRNGDYISKLNRRSDYPKVDNKLITKQLAVSAGIAVPELYAVVETNHDAQRLASLLAPYQDFVIKPAHGSGGEGIVVVDGRQGKLFRKASGQLVTLASLEHHVGNILSGMYSLGGQPDHAMIEYRVRFDPLFKDITFQGVPDIRTIVFKGYPVMAMVRLPTRTSDGKANLHQGAVGAGINIATGVTHHGVFNSLKIDHHPDTGHPIGGHAIPQWDVLLRLAAGCYELTGLGYLGVDVVLDADKGPLILELNARPGLAIQIANGTGLAPYLRKIERDGDAKAPVETRVAYVEKYLADTPQD